MKRHGFNRQKSIGQKADYVTREHAERDLLRLKELYREVLEREGYVAELASASYAGAPGGMTYKVRVRPESRTPAGTMTLERLVLTGITTPVEVKHRKR